MWIPWCWELDDDGCCELREVADVLACKLSSVTSFLDDTLPKRFFTLLDLDRLCLRAVSYVALASPIAVTLVQNAFEHYTMGCGPERGEYACVP